MHILLVLLHVELLSLLQAHFYARLTEVFDEGFALRHTLVCAEEREFACLTFLLVCTLHLRFSFDKELGSKGVLCANQKLYTVLVLIIHLVFTFWHRSTDNQWGTCIINQHRVHLIHDGIVMSALHQVHWACRHIITQVVKTKLVVSTKGNIACIRTATLIGVWFVLINTIYGQTMEHIQRTHPLGVTLSQIVVDSHHVYTLVCQSIQEYWQGSHQCLTFTRSHLGNRATLLFVVLHSAMQHHATNELDIVMHHIPDDLVTTRSP